MLKQSLGQRADDSTPVTYNTNWHRESETRISNWVYLWSKAAISRLFEEQILKISLTQSERLWLRANSFNIFSILCCFVDRIIGFLWAWLADPDVCPAGLFKPLMGLTGTTT